jgi:hypothetical protein
LADRRKFAQQQFDRLFFGPNRVERIESPKAHCNRNARDPDRARANRVITAPATAAAGPATAPAHQDAQLFLTLADDFIKFRDLLIRAAWASTARTTRAVIATVTAAARAATAAPRSAIIASH